MRESTTRYVLLGVLQQIGPASGYDAQKHIAGSIGHFWSESFGQIYPELAALARDGLAAAVPEPTAKKAKRPRTRYRITPRGRSALREWLARPATPQPVRQEALLKIFFGAIGGPETVGEHLAREHALHTERVRFFDEVSQVFGRDLTGDDDLAFGLMVLRCGELVEAARLRWVSESQQLLLAQTRGNKAVLGLWKRLRSSGGGAP